MALVKKTKTTNSTPSTPVKEPLVYGAELLMAMEAILIDYREKATDKDYVGWVLSCVRRELEVFDRSYKEPAEVKPSLKTSYAYNVGAGLGGFAQAVNMGGMVPANIQAEIAREDQRRALDEERARQIEADEAEGWVDEAPAEGTGNGGTWL
jgi:hypothetical protein